MSRMFRVWLTCCGRDDGHWDAPSWEAADQFREAYLDAPGHDRSAIIAFAARRGITITEQS